MYIGGHTGVDAGAGDGQRHAAIDINGIHRELRAVPEVLGVPEFLGIIAEILQEVVARAHGDHGHGGVVVADDAVGHLVYRAVAAAGIEPQILAAFAQLSGQLRGMTLLLRQDTLDVQVVLTAQPVGHIVDLLPAVRLASRGIDDENMLHRGRLLAKFRIEISYINLNTICIL